MDFKKFKRKEKPEKLPKVKTFSQKKANRIVFAGTIILLTTAGIGAFRTNGMANTVDTLDSTVEKLTIQTEQNKTEREVFDYSALSFYVQNFAKDYLNYDSKASDEAKKARLEQLQNYLSLDVKEVDETDDTHQTFKRKFVEASLVRVEETSECLLVYVNVKYDVTAGNKTTTITQEMVLPIQAKDNLFSIVSRPYFVASSLPQGKTKALKQTDAIFDVDTKEKQSVEKFLKMFFSKYANGNKQELMLLMKEPVVTAGTSSFVSISDMKFFDTKQKEVIGTQVSVTFADKQTKETHTENFSLWLSKTENSYFVNTMKHYFTEKEGNNE